MTRNDIKHLAQVTHSLTGCVDGVDRPFSQSEFDQLIDRMLWAIHASGNNPQFDDNQFRAACRDGSGATSVFTNE